MSIGFVRLSSIEGIKRLAKKIATEKSVKHTAALEEAAKIAGYQSFTQAKRALASQKQFSRTVAPTFNARTSKPMSLSDFHTRSRADWTANVNQLTTAGNATISIFGVGPIIQALTPFMGSNRNHAHLPTGGGFDFLSVSESREPGCIEFRIFSGTAVIAKPRRLLLERLASDPAESFLLLELADLAPTDTYGDRTRIVERRQEEVVDIGRGDYIERGALHDGYYADEFGDEQEIPENAQTILRLLNGQIMLVTKGSSWNGSSKTYLGIHDRLSSDAIRSAIQEIIDSRDAA
jgi:hypothetical protein